MVNKAFRYLQTLICRIRRKPEEVTDCADFEEATKEYIDYFDMMPYDRHGPEVTIIHSAIREYARSGYLGHDDGTYSECAREVLTRLSDAGLIVVPAPTKLDIEKDDDKVSRTNSNGRIE